VFSDGDRCDAEAEEFGYELARLPRDITTAISWYMRERGITGRQLAARMKVTPARISRILSGEESLTLRGLAAVCAALGAHFRLELVPNADGSPVLSGAPVPQQRPGRRPLPRAACQAPAVGSWFQ
jgi:transcriptional regulator with XRE-family HTH domain